MHRLLTLAALLAVLAGGAAAQSASGLAVHHGFPLAGSELPIVVEGFDAGLPVFVQVDSMERTAPSLLRYLVGELGATPGSAVATIPADGRGVVSLRVPLVDPADAGRLIDLVFFQLDRDPIGVELLVQPPMVLLPTADGLARLDLRDGRRLLPDLPGPGLVGLALSADGRESWLLRPGGLLEHRAGEPWEAGVTTSRAFGPDSDGLARSQDAGPAFVVLRPRGEGFAPPGRLAFLDGRDELVLEPLGQEVSGRRWAVTPDGLTAFVAEDDLLVREVDLLTGQARLPFTAGFNGDQQVADMVLADGRLAVLTRRGDGRPGALTIYDLATGWVSPFPLDSDPLRLAPVGDGRLLVVPASGARLTVVEDGVPARVDEPARPGLSLLDAAPVRDGALVLARDAEGAPALLAWTAAGGLRPQAVDGPLPGALRLAGAGADLAVLLGAADGVPWTLVPSSGALTPVEGLVVPPGRAFQQLP